MLSFNNLSIEVTRRCNMSCPHCMRGDAQNKDITHEVIDRLFENVSGIGSIVFTGGEPTLNIDAILYVLEVCKKRDISVESFYLVTNGKEVSDDFLIACVRWYAYVADCNGELDMCGVALSTDIFHEPINGVNLFKLKALSFFRERDKAIDWAKTPLQDIGRAKTLQAPVKKEPSWTISKSDFPQYVSAYKDELVFEEVVSVTVDGDVLCGCDYSYDDIENIKIGSVFDPNWADQYRVKGVA